MIGVKKLSFLSLIFFLISCMNPAARGPMFEKLTPSSENKVSVYFYRPLEYDGGTVCLNILLDQTLIGCLGTQGYLVFQAAPGKYRVYIKPDAFPTHTLLEFELSLSHNDNKLIEYSVSDQEPQNAIVSKYTLAGYVFTREVPYAQAEKRLQYLKLSRTPQK